MMKRIIVCSKEEPLHVQLNGINMSEIEELKISGFLGEEDFSLLTEMSQEGGRLHILDLSAVTETECEIVNNMADDVECPKVGIKDDAFVNSVQLEKILFPHNIEQIGNRAFSGCTHLRNVEIPEKVLIWHLAFQDCPLLGEFYIGRNEDLDYIFDDAFAGSIKHYDCDFDGWPVTESGEPVCKSDFNDIFSFEGAVFSYNTGWDEIYMERYPGGNERKEYTIPNGVSLIRQHVFTGCRNLQTIIFPESCSTLKEYTISNCPNLSTLVFKSKALYGSRICHWDWFYDNIITNCPKLQDIYLYADAPDNISFDIFERLDNIGEIVLHVPCFCAKNYWDYEEEYSSIEYPSDKEYIKVWRRFKRIEEFDPIDFDY